MNTRRKKGEKLNKSEDVEKLKIKKNSEERKNKLKYLVWKILKEVIW